MITYRTGNHWGVTIVREGDDVVHLIRDGSVTTTCCDKTPFELPRAGGHRLAVDPDLASCPRRTGDQLVAVVVNGDPALAERISALLNEDEAAVAAIRDLASPRPVANEPAVIRRRITTQAEHRPSSPGGDGLGYGPCVGCGELWPCMASREETRP